VNIARSMNHVVLNETQRFVPVTFKSSKPKRELHVLGDSPHTLSVYCGRYIGISSEDAQVGKKVLHGRLLRGSIFKAIIFLGLDGFIFCNFVTKWYQLH
jgi:hypothetical protein